MAKKENVEATPNKYVSTRTAARYLGVSTGFLEQARVDGEGPAYLKLGDTKKATVRYLLSDLDAFAEMRRVIPSEKKKGDCMK